MYTLAVEIHGIRQLQRLTPDLVGELRRQVIATVEVQGGTFALTANALLVFRFERARPNDHVGVVESLTQVTALLKGRESELMGWSLYLDYLQLPEEALGNALRDAMRWLPKDDEVWLGESAETLLGHFVTLEPQEGMVPVFRLIGEANDSAALSANVEQIALSPSVVDQMLTSFDPNELDGGAVVFHGDDPTNIRVNLDNALSTLFGDAATVGWLVFDPLLEVGPLSPLTTCLSDLALHETPFWLTATERESWARRTSVVDMARSGHTQMVVPEALVADFLMSLELLIVAYVRRATESLAPPVLVCHDPERWSARSLDAVTGIASRLLAGDSAARPLLIVTSRSVSVPASLDSLVRDRIRIPRIALTSLTEKISGLLGDREWRSVNWERLARLSKGRCDSVVHYAVNASHWDHLTDAELAEVDAADLAWRVVQDLDRDSQEVLLTVCYASGVLDEDDLTGILEELGVDRIRIPVVLTSLHSLGLVTRPPNVVPLFPELTERIEEHLGEAAETLYSVFSKGCVNRVTGGSLRATEPLLRVLRRFRSGEEFPRLYHLLLKQLLDRRDFPAAHRLLYDDVPTSGFHREARRCMQTVLYTDRLRLALLQGNSQEAERVRATSERVEADEGCGFVVGDLTLQRARLSFLAGPSKETLALIKRAIMLYQDLDDNAGLARANLDFGMLLLAREDVLGAREYFLMASKMAGQCSDVFEQIRAQILTLTCTFVHGNFSRVLVQAEQLATDSSAAGMRNVDLFSQFVRGRIAFELGRYEEAESIFSGGRSSARFYGFKLPGELFHRWASRSLIYDGRARRGVEILADGPACSESEFFLAEGWLRLADHGKALDALDRARDLGAARPGVAEAVPWSTGFAALEDRAIGVGDDTGVLNRQILALRAYLLAESGREAEGVDEMYRATREMRISEVDPFNRIYFYLYSTILPESGELNLEDRGTVLGKAVRYIQERTSRIDEYAHKTDFMRQNFWNAKLMSYAQIHNLV